MYVCLYVYTYTFYIIIFINVIFRLLLTRHINNCLLMNCTGFIRGLPYVEYMRSAAHMHTFLIVKNGFKGSLGINFTIDFSVNKSTLTRLFWRRVGTGAICLLHRPSNAAT